MNISEQRRWADEAFEQFWANYPRKVGKLAAKKIWDRLRPTPEVIAQMKATLEWQIPTWTDVQFIPHPKTWLSQGRWLDEPQRVHIRGSYTHTPSDCRHEPPCLNVWEHRDRLKGESE